MISRGIWELSEDNFNATNAAIADACMATVKAVGKENVGFINMGIDVSRWCDCVSFADVPLVPNIGIFAGYDPVALDKACLDRVVEAEGVHGSTAEDMEVMESGARKFEICSPLMAGLSEEAQINTGEVIGLGTRDYEIVEVEEKEMEDVAFPLDPRPVGVRFHKLFKKLQPFPYDRYDGHGFNRKEKIDLDRVNTHYDEDS
jgi:hypothetical protein